MRLVHLMMPDQYVSSLADIDFADLGMDNIEAIICDLDNTLIPWGSEEISSQTVQWLQDVRARRIKVAVVSNAMSNRVKRMGERLNVPAIPGATKPRRRGYRRALQMLEVPPERAAVVGDQLFTDVVGGNRLGMHTILVVPLSSRDFPVTKIIRVVERWALAYLGRYGLTRGPSDSNGKREREGK